MDGSFDVSRWKPRFHHTALGVALVGGGNPRSGEISLALHGVLLLDELPTFQSYHLSRRKARRFLCAIPADCSDEFLSMRLFWPLQRHLPLHAGSGRAFRSKISGPLLDCIDIQIKVPTVLQDDQLGKAEDETSELTRARVEAACGRQMARQQKCNARLSVTERHAYCKPDLEGDALLSVAIKRRDLSARAHHRVLRLARGITDLEGCAAIER